MLPLCDVSKFPPKKRPNSLLFAPRLQKDCFARTGLSHEGSFLRLGSRLWVDRRDLSGARCCQGEKKDSVDRSAERCGKITLQRLEQSLPERDLCCLGRDSAGWLIAFSRNSKQKLVSGPGWYVGCVKGGLVAIENAGVSVSSRQERLSWNAGRPGMSQRSDCEEKNSRDCGK